MNLRTLDDEPRKPTPIHPGITLEAPGANLRLLGIARRGKVRTDYMSTVEPPVAGSERANRLYGQLLEDIQWAWRKRAQPHIEAFLGRVGR